MAQNRLDTVTTVIKMLTSWRTSMAGIGMICLGIYHLTQLHLDEALTNIVGGLGLLFARDNQVTSEEAGAK